MDFFLGKGLIMVLLIKHCEAQDLPGSGLASSTAALPHNVLSPPQGPQPSPGAAAAPAIAAPSMKEVEQAVQEASEQVEGGGAEEVLKGLLERVVEAALGEAGGAVGEQQGGAAAAVKGGAGEGKAEAAADRGGGGTVEQASQGEGTGVDGGLGAGEGGLDGEEQQETENGESDTETAGAETDTVGADGGTGLESEEATEAGVEELDETVVAATPPAASEDTPAVVLVVEPTDILEKMEKRLEEMIIKAGGEEVLKPRRKGAGRESTTEGTERGGASEEQLGATEEQTGGETEGGAEELGGGKDAQQPGGDVAAKEESSHVHGAVGVQLPPGGDGGEDSERVGEQEQEGATENETDEEEEEEARGSEVNGGLAGVVGEAEDGEGGAGAWGDGAVGPGEDEGVALNREEVVTQDDDAATEATTESSQTGQTEEQEVLAFSPGASEHGAGDQAPPVQEQDFLPRPTLVWGETGSENVYREDPLLQGTNHTNEIPTTDHLFTHGPAVATAADQDLMEQALATPPETEEAEPGEANELVTDAASPSEEGLLGVEAWKIGGIAAAVIVVLETLLIVVYILKCRTGAESAPVPGACEKGHVEPETPTGGDCIDDYLPAINGDTQLIAELEPSGGKLRQEPQELALSDLPPSPAELLPSAGSAQGSSYDLRTSDL